MHRTEKAASTVMGAAKAAKATFENVTGIEPAAGIKRVCGPARFGSMVHRQVVVVTGASAGVGRASALRFARAGADVALLARGRAGLEAARHDVEKHGARAFAHQVDVADAAAVDDAADRIERDFGPINVWVNDAMATVFAEFETITARPCPSKISMRF